MPSRIFFCDNEEFFQAVKRGDADTVSSLISISSDEVRSKTISGVHLYDIDFYHMGDRCEEEEAQLITDDDGWCPLRHAIENGYTEIVELIIYHHLSRYDWKYKEGTRLRTLFTEAIITGKVEIAKLMLETDIFNTNIDYYDIRTLIDLGHRDMIWFLLMNLRKTEPAILKASSVYLFETKRFMEITRFDSDDLQDAYQHALDTRHPEIALLFAIVLNNEDKTKSALSQISDKSLPTSFNEWGMNTFMEFIIIGTSKNVIELLLYDLEIVLSEKDITNWTALDFAELYNEFWSIDEDDDDNVAKLLEQQQIHIKVALPPMVRTK